LNGPRANPAAAPEPGPGACLLEARGLVVDYPGVRALDRVDFDLRAGEVHALMGENGAGKSTLVRVLSGLRRADAGSVRVGGREVPRTTRAAEAAGISTVHQEIDLIPTMTVADNICLGRGVTRWGLVNRRTQRRRAEAALARLAVSLDVGRLLEDYSIALQQMVAIARALDVKARVLILDEPTSSLDAGETRELLAVVRRLRGQGLGIIFITHFLGQAYEIADRITVLRNAARVGTWQAGELPRPALVEAMTGKVIQPGRRSAGQSPAGDPDTPPALWFKNLGRRRAVAPASGSVRAGEALGLAGLLGSGRSELARLLFGADRADSGEVRAAGERVRAGSVPDAVRHHLAFTPEDRKAQGLVLELSVAQNIMLALQARRGALRPVPRAERSRLVDHYIRSLNIRTPSPDTPVASLSGGNQQKVLLARWLAVQPKVLILDEPARGIDVGARAEIESLIADLKAHGLAVVLISSELDELARLCDRALVLRDRAVVGELSGDDVNEGAMLRLIAQPAPGASEGSAGAAHGA
jgi:galactofuranose transport system ATP-binding protein